MGLEKHGIRQHFGLKELGVLEGPPLRGAGTIVKMVNVVLRVPRAALLVFDDNSASVYVRVTSSAIWPKTSMPVAGSVASRVRSENATVAVNAAEHEALYSFEYEQLEAGAVLGSPVYGPDREAVGVLTAIRNEPHEWTKKECSQLEEMAHLITQEILLRASFETLRIMSAEREH